VVTIFLPVSRDHFLARIFAALELLDCDREQTNLFVLVDGKSPLFVKARNYTTASKFKERLCIQRVPDGKFKGYDINSRRVRIATLHNEAKEHIQPCDYLLLVEDDTVIPPNTLTRLLSSYIAYPYAGFIEGAELGRWGIPYVGAWSADDVYEPSKIETLLPGDGIEQIDAGGLYCALVKWDHYAGHQFEPFGNKDLGPDVNFGLSMRREGYKNYIDWSIKCQHLVVSAGKTESISLSNTTPQRVIMMKEGSNWRCIVE
jgi:hypothetical protein